MAAKKTSAPTKSDILAAISKDTGLSKKQVGSVFESLGTVIKRSLKGHGLFTLPGLAKMKVVRKPATKAREGVNPFTGEKMVFKAKPASKKVRIMPLKNLKGMDALDNAQTVMRAAPAIALPALGTPHFRPAAPIRLAPVLQEISSRVRVTRSGGRERNAPPQRAR